MEAWNRGGVEPRRRGGVEAWRREWDEREGGDEVSGAIKALIASLGRRKAEDRRGKRFSVRANLSVRRGPYRRREEYTAGVLSWMTR